MDHQPAWRSGMAPTLASRHLWMDGGILESTGGKGWRCRGSTGVVNSGGRQGKSGEHWRKGSLEQKRWEQQLGTQQDTQPCELLPWPDLRVPAALPEEGSQGPCRALSRRDVACLSLPSVSITCVVVRTGQASPLLPPSKHFLFFGPPPRRGWSRKLASCSRQGGFEQDNPFGQASNTSM